MILVTNDDGVDSPGLSALARALKTVEDVCVIAPNRNWTAAGHTKTLDRPLRVTEIKLPGTQLAAYSSDGSPSDCVALGFLGVAPERPRLGRHDLGLCRHASDDEQASDVVLELSEVSLVDVEVVRFLSRCEIQGIRIAQCPAYVREWMAREK